MGGSRAVPRALVAAIVVLPAVAFGHARLVSPPPRTTVIGKTPPCDGVPRGSTPTVLTAGQMLEVDWLETIDHPGHFELAISPANDQNFVTLLGDIPDESFAGNENEHAYSLMLQVPDTPCDACTLQLIQFMSDHPPGSQYYYSCADIRIVATGATTTTTMGDGTTSTTSTTIPATCDGLVSYDRATCLITRATALPMCDEPVRKRVHAVFVSGLAKVQAFLDAAVAPTASSARAKRKVAAAGRRLTKLRQKLSAAQTHGRLSAGCGTTTSATLDELGSAIDLLAAELAVGTR
jgi:hypothetical protein